MGAVRSPGSSLRSRIAWSGSRPWPLAPPARLKPGERLIGHADDRAAASSRSMCFWRARRSASSHSPWSPAATTFAIPMFVSSANSASTSLGVAARRGDALRGGDRRVASCCARSTSGGTDICVVAAASGAAVGAVWFRERLPLWTTAWTDKRSGERHAEKQPTRLAYELSRHRGPVAVAALRSVRARAVRTAGRSSTRALCEVPRTGAWLDAWCPSAALTWATANPHERPESGGAAAQARSRSGSNPVKPSERRGQTTPETTDRWHRTRQKRERRNSSRLTRRWPVWRSFRYGTAHALGNTKLERDLSARNGINH